MGLLLSVLVLCVGVLEVIACVRHFQDGYLPLWTPHCAVTSGYTKTHERWRNKPSDSYEFRSTNDVTGALNHAQDQSSETFSQPSVSVENGYTVKHEFQDTKNEVTPSEVQPSDDDLSIFKYENKIEDLHATDIIPPPLGTEESNLDLISTYDKELHIPTDKYDERKDISTNYTKPNLISELVAKHPENIDSQYEVLLNASESTVPFSYHSEETKLDISSNEVEKYSSINEGIEQISSTNKDVVLGNVAGETSNILSEKHAISDVHQTPGEETIPSEILIEPETSRFEYEVDRPIVELNDQRQSTKLSISQEEIIPHSPPNEVPSQNTQICESEVASSVGLLPKESVGVDRIPDKNAKLETDFTSEHFESTQEDDYKIGSHVSLSDTHTESEIPFNNFHEQNLEDTRVPESESEAFETEIQERQKEFDPVYDYEQPGSVDVDEDTRHSRESTPQIYQEYVPLISDQMKSESTSEVRNEDILDVNIESENQPQQELEELSKYDAFESIHDNEEDVYTQEDRESTPQPLSKEIEDIPKIETTLNLQEVESGYQSEISKHPPEPEPLLVPLVTEREEDIRNIGIDTPESRLEKQTTSTEFVVSKDDETDLVRKPEISKEMDKRLPASPLTIDTSEDSPPITRHPSHQSSMSPTQLPSTPTKKSKADISWPTFFPGAPVIKRPSVSFATPEAVFTNEDQELLRQYAEEASDITPCIKKSEETRSVVDIEEKTPSVTDDKSLDNLEASERSDSFDEDVGPITFKERSPSNIVAGNDFSRKELQLQRRKSYKHKRYSSATELSTREEEAEDRSFSENKPGIVRASSLKESRRRFRKPAKASSFEDAMLLETSKTKEKESSVTRTGDASSISVIEEKEAESQRDRILSFEGATKGESEEGGDHQKESNQRNEPNASKLQNERRKEESKTLSDSRKEEEDQEEESSSYSVSEEQSSSQQKSPAKEAFWLIFSGEYTKAMSKDWHSGHFCCWQCDESLTGQRYVLRDDHPYCIKCYESVFANVCEECNKTIGIDSKDLSYKDKHWHEACFLCNKCRVSLVDKQFGSKADKIYCGNCYDAQFASRCDGCGEIFRAGTKKMEYKTRQWHEKCFCCCVCKSAIGTKSFIPREQEIYCATCYEEKFATRCVKCNKIITSGGVTYKNEPWHRECFTCTNCNTSLAGQRFTSRDEKPYCADCFGELFAKRCTACSKPITGIGGTRFISFEDRHWHNDCFICATCKTSLVGRGFITDADDIICPECAKQKLM